MIRNVVVFPHPLGPSREKNSPPSICNDTSLTATVSPNCFVRDVRVICPTDIFSNCCQACSQIPLAEVIGLSVPQCAVVALLLALAGFSVQILEPNKPLKNSLTNDDVFFVHRCRGFTCDVRRAVFLRHWKRQSVVKTRVKIWFTSCGLAFPRVARITCPTRNPIAFFVPSR